MRIETYFQQIQAVLTSCRGLRASNVTYDKRGSSQGFIRGELYFVDGSVLHFREAVDTELIIDRLMYTYQYMSTTRTLIFRYDNTGHHKKLNLPTYPHHKHDGSEENIAPSPAPSLAAVLSEVERVVQLPFVGEPGQVQDKPGRSLRSLAKAFDGCQAGDGEILSGPQLPRGHRQPAYFRNDLVLSHEKVS